MSVLIKDAVIVSQDEKRRIFKGSIYIEDGIIKEISEKGLAIEADFKISGNGKVVLPGLINTHTHIPMTLFRGYGDDMALEDWLKKRIWPAEARLDRNAVKAGTDLGLLEMILSGTTCYADMYFFEDTIAERTKKAGLRGFLGFSFLDFGTPEYKREELFSRCEDFIKRWINEKLITPVIAPHSSYTCSPETLMKCSELSKKYNLIIHTHCSETQQEIYDVKNRYGVRPLEQFERTGILSNRTLLAHCGWITKGEVKKIAKVGASVSHCPVSNMKLATGGYMPLPELIDEGANVSIGTDGAASNNTLDMFESMKFTALLHKHHRWDPCVAKAQQVLDMATIGGAKALGIDGKIGSIEEGKVADIIVVDFKKAHLTPIHDVVSHLVYAVRSSDVVATIVNGKVLMIDRNVLTLKEDEVLEFAQKEALRITSD
ncbi:MAG: amidohydrolase [Thermoplasmata archaeon]|nr:amidohydrolase [Thermoplasmata archaeon]